MSRSKNSENAITIERENETVDSASGASANIKAGSSKSRKGLLRAHLIVLRALEVANLRLSRVVTVPEIAESMLLSEFKWIEQNYAKGIGMVISSILGMLQKQELVFSPGRVWKNRYYGSTSILDPEKSPLPNTVSRRRRVLGIIYRSVEYFNRAVRTGDVLEFATGLDETHDIDTTLITRDIMNLAETGEIVVVGTVRGGEKGANLYLPADLNPDSYRPTEPLTWLEKVSNVFTQLWEEEMKCATDEGRRPRPIATGAVRARLAAAYDWNFNPEAPWLLPNALQQLAQTDSALIRKVARDGKKWLMWAPVGFKDEMLDLGDVFASDAERIAEAVARGCQRLCRPIKLSDVKDEVEMDPTLQPAGRLQLRNILADISKERVDSGNGTRRLRVARRCFNVGKVNGDSYYWHDIGALDEALNYVHFRQIELCWNKSATLADPSAYLRRTLPSVSVGRAMIIKSEAERLANDIDGLLRASTIDGATRHEAEMLSVQVREVADAASSWLTNSKIACLNIPNKVDLTIPGWTAAKWLQALKPLYPAAKDMESPHRINRYVSTEIRRYRNPDFESRFSKVPHKASEYLYDRTDALLLAATRWGGHECRMQAMMARSEIGTLRDLRFVYPAVESDIFDERLRGVACLAFLWSDDGNERLKHLALNDRVPAIRQSALWAYGFAGGDGAEELLRESANSDSDVRTRAFFMQIVACLESNDGLWWKV